MYLFMVDVVVVLNTCMCLVVGVVGVADVAVRVLLLLMVVVVCVPRLPQPRGVLHRTPAWVEV